MTGAVPEAWTGHSERATLTSALAAHGVSKDDRDPLGRWAPEASDEYVRTYRALVRRLVGLYVRAAHRKDADKRYDEAAGYAIAEEVLVKRGYAAEEVKEAIGLTELGGKVFQLSLYQAGLQRVFSEDTPVEDTTKGKALRSAEQVERDL